MNSLAEALRAVLARDSLQSLTGRSDDCICANGMPWMQREFENGICPHQKARAMLERELGKDGIDWADFLLRSAVYATVVFAVAVITLICI